MKLKLLLPLLCTALLVPCVKAADAYTLAVFDFESRDEGAADLGKRLSALLNAQLSAEEKIITVERAELEKALGEQELGLSGVVAADTAAKVGNLAGAQVLVTGRIFKADKELVAVAKIIGTETGRVYGELSKAQAGAPLTELAADLARKIAAALAAKGNTLVARAEPAEDRAARIKRQLKGAKLPTVSVKIGERHFGQPVIDPAAETELARLLQQCAFTVVGENSKEKADVEITGDAFSAFGLRKGNLISCKARVELKVQKRTGELLANDRQTSVAVDIAEQTAAKTALQIAAAELAERIIPQLTK